METVKARLNVKDGFTLTDTYSPKPANRYEGVSITYRPALSDEVFAFQRDSRGYVAKGRDLVLKHVTQWNIQDTEPGTVAPLTPDVMKEIPFPVLDWMIDCIHGYAPKVEREDAKN